MPAVTIEWKRTNEEGVREQVLAERIGEEWTIHRREKRFDRWKVDEDPPLDDLLELLDGVRRRIGRGLLRKDEEARVVTLIRRKFPDASIPR